MAHTYEELNGQTVAQLRDIAKDVEHEAVQGYSTMRKEDLLLGLCTAYGIDPHVHHRVVGIDKRKVKAQIRTLKAQRGAVLEARDTKELKRLRRRIHRLKRKLRRATV